MKIKYVYTGSWFPRTKLHLREIYNFLKFRETSFFETKKELSQLAEELSIKRVEYRGGVFDTVIAHTNGIKIQYDEDGLLLIKSEGHAWPAGNSYLEEFYQEKLTPFLQAMFNKGAPSLEKVRTGLRVRPVVAVATEMKSDEVFDFFRAVDDSSHAEVSRGGVTVNFGDKVILIITRDPDSELVQYLIRFYTFFREYESYLYRFMLVDRRIWEKIDEIRDHSHIQGKDLPGIRDQLVLFKRDVSVIKLRLSQMDNYLQERQADIEFKKLRPALEFFKAYRFEKVSNMHEYMVELVAATESYVDDAIDLLELLYQESQQKEINTLQVIFLIGTVANIFFLGGLGELNLTSLVTFGVVAVTASLCIYWIWHYIFKRLRLHKAISMLEKPERDRDYK